MEIPPPNTPNLPLLPMHLALSLSALLSWPIALANANEDLLPSKKRPTRKSQQKKLQENLHREAKNRCAELLRGLSRFADAEPAPTRAEPPCIWQEGNARLLDYSSSNPQSQIPNPILFIPSLINRYYILDLERERSLLRFLAAQGASPLVMDWGAPGENEKDYNVADYVTEILLPAIDFLHRTSGRPVTLAGYCMGGVLALASAQLRPKKVGKLALFATPWDFHCEDFKSFVLDKTYQSHLSSLISACDLVPADIIQSLFYVTDPFLFQEKFRRYLSLEEGSRAAKDFVALERWVNDGVPMTSRVAHDCLIGWAQENKLAAGRWQVAEKKISPDRIKQPVFIAVPKQDHVVPEDCAMALANLLPHATRTHPGSGHVGMMVGSRAKSECWQPFLEWLAE